MKKILILSTGILAFSIGAMAQDKAPWSTTSLAGKNISKVDAETTGGNITVSGSGTGESRIEVYIWGNNGRDDLSKDEIQKRLNESYDLKVSVEGNTIVAKAKQKERNMNWKRSLSISFKVYVGKNTATHLRTSGGNINLDNLNGSQDFSTSGGNLNLENLDGKITGRTSGGNVNVSHAKNDIDLTTSGGNVTASDCTGKIHLETSGGGLKLENLSGDIDASTSGGNVRGNTIDGELSAHTSGGNVDLDNLSCSLETSTSGGNIDVDMKALGKYVKIRNSGGSITLNLPDNKGLDLNLSADRIKTTKLNNFSGTVEEDRIDGKVNGGGVPIDVRGGSRISLTLK